MEIRKYPGNVPYRELSYAIEKPETFCVYAEK